MTTSVYTTTAENLSTATIARYREQGFVHIPGVISKEEAADFCLAALEAQKHFKNRTSGRKSERIFTQLVNVWTDDEKMRALTFHPNIATVAEKLAGVPLRIWHDHILIKQPHNNASTEFHQDQPYWPHANSTQALSAWVALVDVPVEKGCMTFIPGVQYLTELNAQDLTDEHDLMRKSPALVWKPRMTLPLRAGDCTFHHARTPHMATPNFTDDPRVAHIIIYIDARTIYTGAPHVVTDPLNLKAGELLEGKYFPAVDEFAGR